MAKIAIDNGHGLKTAGKRTPKMPDGKVIHEWQFNHATATILKGILEKQGHQVLMVSDTEADTPLMARINKANQWGADVFVSIHYNALNSIWGSHGGIETLYNPNSANGKRLAEVVQKELINATKLRDRGARPRTNLGVLNYTKMVAILPELGFMDNLEEAKLMLDVNYQNKCANAIANGINKYLGFKPINKGGNVVNTPKPQINNNQPSAWASDDWNWGIAKKLVDGTNPQNNMTREQLIAVLHRFAKLYGLEK